MNVVYSVLGLFLWEIIFSSFFFCSRVLLRVLPYRTGRSTYYAGGCHDIVYMSVLGGNAISGQMRFGRIGQWQGPAVVDR